MEFQLSTGLINILCMLFYIKFDQGLMRILEQNVLLSSLLIQRGSKKLWQESTILDERSDISIVFLFYHQMRKF